MQTYHSLNNRLLHHLNTTPKIGAKTLGKIVEILETADIDTLLSSPKTTLSNLPVRTQTLLEDALSKFSSITPLQELDRFDISLVSLLDENYPPLLREIPDAPPLLYIRGNFDALSIRPALAIVGTRKPTRYGTDVTHSLAHDLARASVAVVSGMALGLDAEAHKGALEAQGTTIAVLGNGLADSDIAPRSHLPLMRHILNSGGCLISEYPPGTQASVGTFPARNRIIAGLSHGTLIVEATERSGTLITARHAVECNREVFAVPGSILSALSHGPNELIQQGAKLVRSSADILETFSFSAEPSATKPAPESNTLSEAQNTILRILEGEPKEREELARLSKLPAQVISIHLTTLEMEGFIRNIGSNTYRRV